MPASAAWARPEDIIENLSSLDTGARLKAIRDVKNQIIGNKTKKLSYIKLGAVPRVVEILASDTETPLLVQSAAAVGSFACGMDAGVRAVLDSGVLPHLLKILSNKNGKVVEAGARSLKMIFQSAMAPRNDVFQGRTLEVILELLRNDNDNVAEVAASVLARCCETPEHRQRIADAGALAGLVNLLEGSLKRREAALEALAALTRGNERECATLLAFEGGATLAAFVQFTKDKWPRTRLLSCTCLANVSRACANASAADIHHARSVALSSLLKLIDEPGEVGEEAPLVLANLVGERAEHQRMAYDAKALCKLVAIVQRPHAATTARQRETVLTALAELCSQLEVCRLQVIEIKGKDPIVRALAHPSAGVRVAACACLRSLSRSMKTLRACLTSLAVTRPLFCLLSDPDPTVQSAAVAAACNVVLDFSASRDAAPERTCAASRLATLARSMDTTLRLNSVRALSNLLFLADSCVKSAVLHELSHSTLVDLLNDSDEEIGVETLELCRNVAHGRVEDVDLLLPDGDTTVLGALERRLGSTSKNEVRLQVVNVMVNIASGSEAQKDAFMASPLATAFLPRLLSEANWTTLRVAATWCIVNLTSTQSPGAALRAHRLRAMGVQSQLEAMRNDTCVDLKVRVEQALQQISSVAL